MKTHYNIIERDGGFAVTQTDEYNNDKEIEFFDSKDGSEEFVQFKKFLDDNPDDDNFFVNLDNICENYALCDFNDFDIIDEQPGLNDFFAVLPKSNRAFYAMPGVVDVWSTDEMLSESADSDSTMFYFIMTMLERFHKNNPNGRFDQWEDTPKLFPKIKGIIGKKDFICFAKTVFKEFGSPYEWKDEYEEKLVNLANDFVSYISTGRLGFMWCY